MVADVLIENDLQEMGRKHRWADVAIGWFSLWRLLIILLLGIT